MLPLMDWVMEMTAISGVVNFHCRPPGYQRAGHLDYVPMPGVGTGNKKSRGVWQFLICITCMVMIFTCFAFSIPQTLLKRKMIH